MIGDGTKRMVANVVKAAGGGGTKEYGQVDGRGRIKERRYTVQKAAVGQRRVSVRKSSASLVFPTRPLNGPSRLVSGVLGWEGRPSRHHSHQSDGTI